MSAILFLKIAVVCIAMLLTASLACGEQQYVSRYDVYAGYAFLNIPHIDLFENGVQFQAAVRPTRWYSLGFDYTNVGGELSLTPSMLTTDVRDKLTAMLTQLAAAGRLPTGYSLAVPTHSRTQTFAAGPQLSYRRFSKVTLFLRPSIGMIYEKATPKPADAISTAVVQQLAPSGKKTDWTPFYGFGGGGDLNFSKHVGLRVQADLVYDHLFSDLLKDGRFTTRFSVGPCFNFGRNVK